MRLAFDIEANGLVPDKVWCLVAVDIDTGEEYVYKTKSILEGTQLLSQAETLIGHNLLGYDIPVLEKLYGFKYTGDVVDTLVLSRLHNPSRDGGHSLRAWGEFLGFPKGDHDDWNTFSEEMVLYCKRDVQVTCKLYSYLQQELEQFGNESIELEHQVQKIIQGQIRNGWKLDEKKCYDLIAELTERKMEVEDEVHERFIPLPVAGKEISPRYKKDGSLSVVGLKFLGDDWTTVVGSFTRVDFPEFNLGSRQQIGRYLQHFGWRPKEFTETGQAIVSETILASVEIPEAQMIAEYLLIVKRLAQVNSWLDALGSDGRVHGDVNSNGAVTGRMTHSKPNVAQVPASYSPYGEACRSCWTVPEGKKLVGCDAAGLELRMLAHYMNDDNYTQEILTGDVHTANQRAAGLDTRDQAKTFIYAFLYGAGDSKIGSITGGSARHGKLLKERFLSNTPALGELRGKVEKAAKRGYLKGLDGRRLWIRSEHAALNTLLQSAGALVMKKALVLLDEFATKWKLDYKFVGNIHDEIQAEVAEKDASKFGYLAVECIKAAGIAFNLNCPLDGDYKIGTTWAETH